MLEEDIRFQSLLKYVASIFNQIESSDIIVHVKDEKDPKGEDVKIYNLHKIVLGQSKYFESMWFKNYKWKENQEKSHIIFPFHSSDWINLEVLDIVFQMFYTHE